MPGEPLDQLRDQLDPGACRLANLPGRIWLFGGAFGGDKSAPPSSLREAFWRKSLATPPSPQLKWTSELEIPENHPGWWAFSGYDDLLTFERDACHLARAIVLIPESPGSLAELGALAVDDSIVSRLLVVVQSRYLEAPARESFLNLGPLKRAEALKNRCVIGATGNDLPDDDFEAIAEFVHERLPSLPSTERLRVDMPTHRFLLTADLVDLLLICRPQELQVALNHFQVDLSIQDIERSARLLEFFGLIRIEHRGSEHFLVRREKADRTWVNYTARDGMPPFDRSRFKLARRSLLEGNRRLMSVLERTE
ncbi:retron St85 family effector protein [Methyloversatilis discipulorum]|uniref:retron St85 family effector protein n=1 Tax=Methyloversatilis discipulorum TaxID=1119528 RepID=UPI003AF8F3F4